MDDIYAQLMATRIACRDCGRELEWELQDGGVQAPEACNCAENVDNTP